jgi:hypothetical protein
MTSLTFAVAVQLTGGFYNSIIRSIYDINNLGKSHEDLMNLSFQFEEAEICDAFEITCTQVVDQSASCQVNDCKPRDVIGYDSVEGLNKRYVICDSYYISSVKAYL